MSLNLVDRRFIAYAQKWKPPEIPLWFLLGWIAQESLGNLADITLKVAEWRPIGERSWFQVSKPEIEDMKVDPEKLLVDPDYSMQVGIALVRRYMRFLDAIAGRSNWAFAGSSDYWRMVKLIHAIGPGSFRNYAEQIKSPLWTEWERYSQSDPHLYKWIGNANAVYDKGRELESESQAVSSTPTEPPAQASPSSAGGDFDTGADTEEGVGK